MPIGGSCVSATPAAPSLALRVTKLRRSIRRSWVSYSGFGSSASGVSGRSVFSSFTALSAPRRRWSEVVVIEEVLRLGGPEVLRRRVVGREVVLDVELELEHRQVL